MQLSGNGTLGDGTLEGNEEALTTFSDALISKPSGLLENRWNLSTLVPISKISNHSARNFSSTAKLLFHGFGSFDKGGFDRMKKVISEEKAADEITCGTIYPTFSPGIELILRTSSIFFVM
jgi:hypothetical protein